MLYLLIQHKERKISMKLLSSFLALFDLKTKQKAFFNFCIFFLLSFYFFGIWFSSNIYPWNYLTIAIVLLISIFMSLYMILFKKLFLNSIIVLFLLFIFLTIFSNLINNVDLTKRVLLNFLFCSLIYMYAYKNTNNIKIMLVSFLLGSLLFYFFYIGTYFKEIISFSFDERLGSDFDNLNTIARCFSFNSLIYFFLFFKKKKYYLIPLFLLSFLLCMACGSISNLLCIILSIFIFIFLTGTKKQKILFTLFSVIILIVAFFILQLPNMEYFKNRIYGIITSFLGIDLGVRNDGSATARFVLLLDGFKLFLERPIFGFGEGQIQLFTHGKGSYSHNNVVELLASYGLFTFLIFEFFLFAPIFQKDNRKGNEILLPVLIFMIIFQFFLVTYYLKVEVFFIAIALANTHFKKDYYFALDIKKIIRNINNFFVKRLKK